jgi:hypothetical protein
MEAMLGFKINEVTKNLIDFQDASRKSKTANHNKENGEKK